jgi:hypothetical protein
MLPSQKFMLRACVDCFSSSASFLLSAFTRPSERDTTEQRIGSVDEVIAVVTELVDGALDWEKACERLPPYDGTQAID